MTDVAIPSTSRPVSSEVLKGAIQNAGFGDWIAPTDEDHYASEVGLVGTPLNAFDAIASPDSLTVTIATGEGYVGGAWIGRDDQTDVTLDSSTTNQEIAVGPQYQASDALRIDVPSVFGANEDYHIIWEFNTDSNGVTATASRRDTSPPLETDGSTISASQPIDMGGNAIDNATNVITQGFLMDRDDYGLNFGVGGQNNQRPFIAPYQDGGSNFSNELTYDTGDDNWRIETQLEVVEEGQWTVHSSGQYEIQKDGTDGAGIINFKTQ